MRLVLACLIAFGFLVGAAERPVPGLAAAGDFVVAAQEVPSEIDVDINAEGGGAWYANPIWIAIGVVALIAVVALLVTASRGGTTVIKD